MGEPDANVGARPDWVRDAVFYEIFPDRFDNAEPANDPPGTAPWGAPPTRENFCGGDLAGVGRRLPYLAELGVTAVYLTPIFRAGTNHRYDTHDYRAVDPALGDLGALRETVQEAHRLGIRIVLDGVFNHCGDGFWAFRDLRERGLASPYRDWFFPRRFPVEQDPPTYQTCGGAPYLPKLNTATPELRRYLLDVATFWIAEADIDGWRLDVPWKVPVGFWEEFRAVVKAVKPDAYLVGEIWREPHPWLGVFDGVMNYRLRDSLLDYCVRDHMDAEDLSFESRGLVEGLGEAAGWMLNLLGSHDTPRLLTLCGGDERRAVLALTALFTYPGVPMIYYGDEIGLEGGDDPDCRRCMEWERARWKRTIHETCRALAALRRRHAALRRGSWEPLLTFNGVFAYRRRHGSDEVVIVMNPRQAQRELTVPLGRGTTARWRELLSGDGYEAHHDRLVIPALAACSALLLAPEATPGEDGS